MNSNEKIKKAIERSKELQKNPEKKIEIIESDETYYLLIGFTVDALLWQNATGYHKDVKHSAINPFLNAKESEKIGEKLLVLFKNSRQSYFHGTYLGIILSEIIEYKPTGGGKIGQEEQRLIMLGFLFNNNI